MSVDPQVIAGAISGLVSLITGYMTYRVGMKNADQKGTPAPEKPDDRTLKQGEQAIEVVKAGVAQYGDEDEQADLANFERNPTRYEDALRRVLTDVASRNPAFAQQLQTLAQQANIQTGGVQGTVNVSDQGRIYGPTAGTNTGTMSGTYTFGREDDNK